MARPLLREMDEMKRRRSRKTTMLELVVSLQAEAKTTDEVVSRAVRLIRSRRVVLCGNFARCPI